MNAFRLIARSAAYYWRTHLGVAAGAAVATAVLVGALAVGDSVRYTLRTQALRRLGNTALAMSSSDRFFRAISQHELIDTPSVDLVLMVGRELATPIAPVLLLDGSASTPDAAGRANGIQIVGVDGRFWHLGEHTPHLGASGDAVILNTHLARQLGAGVGDTVILRMPAVSYLPREAPLSTDRNAVAAMRVTVREIVDDLQFGRFSLRANQLAPQTAFVSLRALQEAVKLPGKANVLLVGGAGSADGPTKAEADAALRKHFRLADAGLALRDIPGGIRQLSSPRIFLDEPVSGAAMEAGNGLGILSYFADEIRLGEKAAPYCIVAGMDANRPGLPPSPVPPDLADDEIILNQWLADDLGAKPGDAVTLNYRTLGPARTLEKHTKTFRVADVVPVEAPGVDPNLMPEFPGLADVDNCTDWEPGVEIDTARIRDQDEAYWDEHRGTPKAFITLPAAQGLWANRFGNLTAARYPAARDPNALAAAISHRIDPRRIGLFFAPVREQALAAANPTSDFGGLFLGLSFFLIAAAVLLTGLLFVLGIEQRSRQVGLLLAVGFTPGRVRRWMLAEGGLLAVLGAIVGAALGLAYARAVLAGLATVWRGAASSSRILFHAEPASVALGAAIGLLVALAAMWIALRRQGRAPARELMAAGAQGRPAKPAGRERRRAALVIGAMFCGGAVAVARSAGSRSGMAAAGAFFGAGSMVLFGALAFCYALLARLGASRHVKPVSVPALGIRSAGLRRGRSLATVALLACGIFLVASVEVFRLDPRAGAADPAGGTGGFALYGESSAPVLIDMNAYARGGSVAGRLPGLDPNELAGADFVQLRIHQGDDASCLNLNRAQSPRVLGIRPGDLAGRFTFVEQLDGMKAFGARSNPWRLLEANLPEGVIPAVADDPTLQWALQKGLGDEIEVLAESGRPVRLRLVGRINGSILQGSVVISDENFRRVWPSASGFGAMLVDVPPERAEALRRELTAGLETSGLAMMPAADRLAMFAEVQNTYLSIFAALGGLGLVLGSVAIGVVVLRNVLARRGELALLRAVGFDKRRLIRMVLWEHWALLGLGMACGVAAAVVAVIPAIRSPTAAAPFLQWLAILAAVGVSGVLWTVLAARAALRGNLLAALRSE